MFSYFWIIGKQITKYPVEKNRDIESSKMIPYNWISAVLRLFILKTCFIHSWLTWIGWEKKGPLFFYSYNYTVRVKVIVNVAVFLTSCVLCMTCIYVLCLCAVNLLTVGNHYIFLIMVGFNVCRVWSWQMKHLVFWWESLMHLMVTVYVIHTHDLEYLYLFMLSIILFLNVLSSDFIVM